MQNLPSDPTRNEIEELITLNFASESFDEIDIECAIYWFAANYHSGQWSNLYSILSMSEYNPGPLERGPRSVAKLIYQTLEEEFS
jgi:hypothetical protein